ncbi:MAG: L-ribulose-5-phosphate 4-epimerase [Tannerellaceae bacterium]|jgi:L-ribulose-5-phosphate 4-epimerase|nr:L-ribulose-5-phosphate 4-epimerase [Tannerellaceae bacterium]
MIEDLKNKVLNANLELVRRGLVLFTWGNVSAIDRLTGCVVIKPSGVPYETMAAGDMVVTDLDGKVIDGRLKPSSDLPTHLVLYNTFPNIGGVVHTHSTYATAWAQAGRSIPNLGTTHSDYFKEHILCTRMMTSREIEGGRYEHETGRVIVECFDAMNPDSTPGVLVNNHGPFAWGKDADNAVHNAAVMEEVAKIAYLTMQINPQSRMNEPLTRYHYERKHGAKAYYGQEKEQES